MCAKEPDDSNSKIIESFFTIKKNLKLRKNILYEYIFLLLIKEKVLESVLTYLDLVYLGLQTDTSCCE